MSLLSKLTRYFRKRVLDTKQMTKHQIDAAAARVVYADREEAFVAYFNLWLKDKQSFFRLHADKFQHNSLPEYLTHMAIISAFGNQTAFYKTIDWRGEENVGEIEEFCENQIKKNIHWQRTQTLQKDITFERQRDGSFILDLFKAIDQDLQEGGHRLLFRETNSDSYHFTILRTADITGLRSQFGNAGYFTADKLR